MVQNNTRCQSHGTGTWELTVDGAGGAVQYGGVPRVLARHVSHDDTTLVVGSGHPGRHAFKLKKPFYSLSQIHGHRVCVYTLHTFAGTSTTVIIELALREKNYKEVRVGVAMGAVT